MRSRHSATTTASDETPSETGGDVRAFAKEWNAAIGSGDCAAFKRLVTEPRGVRCSTMRAQGKAVAEAAYGPDGVLDTEAETCDLVDDGGRLKADTCFQKMPRTVGSSLGKAGTGFEAEEGVRPQPLGGNGFWRFCGLALKGDRYLTMPVLCAPAHYFRANPCASVEPTAARRGGARQRPSPPPR